jgi:hypothetical protein
MQLGFRAQGFPWRPTLPVEGADRKCGVLYCCSDAEGVNRRIELESLERGLRERG